MVMDVEQTIGLSVLASIMLAIYFFHGMMEMDSAVYL
jgi:hypothetical protein